jgi:hypothetical protein
MNNEQLLRKALEDLEDAAEQWASYVEVDTAPCPLVRYLEPHFENIRAALTQPAPAPGAPQAVVRLIHGGQDWVRWSDYCALRDAPVAAVPDAEMVQLYGIKGGKGTLLGEVPMPVRMKARELAREQFGHFEDDDGSDAELCFGAMEQLLDHIERIRSASPTPPVQQARKVPYTEWVRGDILRVIASDSGDLGPFELGQLVEHADNDGNAIPYCTEVGGARLHALLHTQLEFASRPGAALTAAQAEGQVR